MSKYFMAAAVLFSASTTLFGQDYVTPDQFAFRVDSDLVYGVATDYLGNPATLSLDLYKPLGDADPARPLLVLRCRLFLIIIRLSPDVNNNCGA